MVTFKQPLSLSYFQRVLRLFNSAKDPRAWPFPVTYELVIRGLILVNVIVSVWVGLSASINAINIYESVVFLGNIGHDLPVGLKSHCYNSWSNGFRTADPRTAASKPVRDLEQIVGDSAVMSNFLECVNYVFLANLDDYDNLLNWVPLPDGAKSTFQYDAIYRSFTRRERFKLYVRKTWRDLVAQFVGIGDSNWSQIPYTVLSKPTVALAKLTIMSLFDRRVKVALASYASVSGSLQMGQEIIDTILLSRYWELAQSYGANYGNTVFQNPKAPSKESGSQVSRSSYYPGLPGSIQHHISALKANDDHYVYVIDYVTLHRQVLMALLYSIDNLCDFSNEINKQAFKPYLLMYIRDFCRMVLIRALPQHCYRIPIKHLAKLGLDHLKPATILEGVAQPISDGALVLEHVSVLPADKDIYRDEACSELTDSFKKDVPWVIYGSAVPCHHYSRLGVLAKGVNSVTTWHKVMSTASANAVGLATSLNIWSVSRDQFIPASIPRYNTAIPRNLPLIMSLGLARGDVVSLNFDELDPAFYLNVLHYFGQHGTINDYYVGSKSVGDSRIKYGVYSIKTCFNTFADFIRDWTILYTRRKDLPEINRYWRNGIIYEWILPKAYLSLVGRVLTRIYWHSASELWGRSKQ